MNITQIKYFVAVVGQGSFSRAAKSQYVTVQAVSKAIADLERELGRELFVRESRGVSPTSFGQAFYRKAERVLRDFEELESFSFDSLSGKEVRRPLKLALCSPAFHNNERARMNIGMFVERHLGIPAKVQLATGDAALPALRGDGVDALITIGAFNHPETDCVAIGTVLPGVVMSERHPLAQRESVLIDEVNRYPVAVSRHFDHFNESILTMYRKRGLASRLEESIEDAEGFLRFLEAQEGLVFTAGIPALGVYPGTVMRLIASEDAVAVPICLVSLKARKTPLYLTLERFMSSELIFSGGRDEASCPPVLHGASPSSSGIRL